ncbi:DoxX-like family protein [Sediminibacillus massiliensis]|uniref:DoxX-like family protein n=1 Tax=Sediminibacillus massiliensis TaxID=1926277 RepID=UPI000988520E|nr:DoxX-like family protein [Sediminibacillus massiliensis]
MKNKPIYVEIPIKTEMDKLWEATQTPAMHEMWDLRFSSIKYLPKEDNKPQLFSYQTKIGFGLKVEGWGRSIGSFNADDGSRTSSLQFGTDQSVSIIREGRGYWKYEPGRDDITFLTQYTYETNFGIIGKIFDRFLFRPIMGWATALSFDVLKRWLEQGESPASQFTRFFSQALLMLFFFFIWIYHGLIPKILVQHADEIGMLENLIPISTSQAEMLTAIAGMGEIAFAFTWLVYSNKKRLFALQLILFPILTIGAIAANPASLGQPFNPLTFNSSLIILSIIGYMLGKDIPTAKNCRRKR